VVSTVTLTLAFNRQTLPFRTDCVVAGTECLVSTNSVDILQAAAQWRSVKKRSCVPSFEMEVLVASTVDTRCRHSAYFRGVRHLVFAVLPPRNFITYDLLRKHVHAVLSAATASDPTFWNTLLLPITMGVLGTTIGVAPLHCACLERHGSGLLLAGVSGAGKSTLAAALAQRGFALISDDWTYVSKQQSALFGHGLSAPVKLLPDAVRFFPYLRNSMPQPTLNGEVAYEINPAHSMGCTVKSFSHPRRIFFLERTLTPGCDFVPCRPEYVRSFFEDSVERLPDEIAEAKKFRASVFEALSLCPAWVLRTGESPQETAEAIDTFLAEATHAIA